MPTPADILATEYSEPFDALRLARTGHPLHAEFDGLRRNRMLMSFFKYGPLQTNYSERLIDSIKSLVRYLEKYQRTGNTEYLVDVANFAMIEFMAPQHPLSHFDALAAGPAVTPTDPVARVHELVLLYRENGNGALLCDIANAAMAEFEYPLHPNAHFEGVDDGKSNIVGMGVNQIKAAFGDVA